MKTDLPEDLQFRILAMLDGDLEGEALSHLDAELRANGESRVIFHQLVALHSALELQTIAQSEIAHVTAFPTERLLVRKRQRMFRNSMLATAAALMLSALILWLKMVPLPPSTLAEFRVTPDSVFTLTHTGDGEAPAGNVLREGSRLELPRGTVEGEFASGARFVIEAPCDLLVLSEDAVSINEGVSWFQVPAKAIGFTVETAQLKVVDLGTEFGVVALEDGQHEVHVTKGSVEVAAGRPDEALSETILEAGEARQVNPQGGFQRISLQPDRFSTALPELLTVNNPSFEVDRNENPSGLLSDGQRGHFVGSELTGWTTTSGDNLQVQVGWRGTVAEELHPSPPVGNQNSQALSLISGASVLNVTHVPWSSLREGDKLTLRISVGMRGGAPVLDWNEESFFGLTDDRFSPSDIPTINDTVIHSGLISENPAAGNQSGDGSFTDVTLHYNLQPADPSRPGNIGILIVGRSSEPGNSLHQSFFDNVRLFLTR